MASLACLACLLSGAAGLGLQGQQLTATGAGSAPLTSMPAPQTQTVWRVSRASTGSPVRPTHAVVSTQILQGTDTGAAPGSVSGPIFAGATMGLIGSRLLGGPSRKRPRTSTSVALPPTSIAGPGHGGNGKTLIFDLDGTLVETAPELLRAVNALLEKAPKLLRRPDLRLDPLLLAHIKTMIGDGMKMLTKRAFAHAFGEVLHLSRSSSEAREAEQGLTDAEIDVLHDELDSLYKARVCSAEPLDPPYEDHLYDGVEETLLHLSRAGYQLAVCTNKPQEFADQILTKLDIDHYFSGPDGEAVVVGGDAVRNGEKKPSPDHLLQAIEEAGGDPRSSIMIGDGHNDVLVALNTRERGLLVPVIGLTYGYTHTPLKKLLADGGASKEEYRLLDHFTAIPEAVTELFEHLLVPRDFRDPDNSLWRGEP